MTIREFRAILDAPLVRDDTEIIISVHMAHGDDPDLTYESSVSEIAFRLTDDCLVIRGTTLTD